MASEELQQRYPDGKGKKIGEFEVFETQLTTLRQFGEHGILPNKDYGQYSTQKCDSLIIKRLPFSHAVAIGEHKKPGVISDSNWALLAKDLIETKCRPTGALIGYLTDGVRTWWFDGQDINIILISREDGKPMPSITKFKDRAFVAEINFILNNYDPNSNKIWSKVKANPDLLAKEVWQTIWRLKADRPEDCLATFIELFLFKFLNDLGLMKKDKNGADVSLDHIMSLDRETSYRYYDSIVRPHMKEMFPTGKDGYSIINGIVLQATNRDHNIIFYEILKKFVKFGTLKNTEPEFKTRLYESFLQESKTTTTFGQFFTPRKVVAAIHDMARVDALPHGKEICDPASGVGGFVLEQMARNLDAQWFLKGNRMIPSHKWHAYEIVPKTAILAKANALVHCGDLLADQPARIKSFAKWINTVFLCEDKTSLGSLEKMYKEKFDLIITNPPFVVSGSADIGKLIKANNKRKTYFGRKYSGVEGLFIQFIVQSLKRNGEAWVLLPETFFLRTTDQMLRLWILKNCILDLLAILPERTFFNTPKRVVITHIKKRQKKLSDIELNKNLSKERVLLFAISEIGETRDAKRLPCESDLPLLVDSYLKFSVGIAPDNSIKRATVANAIELFRKKTVNIRHSWEKSIAKSLGLLGTDEDPLEAKKNLDLRMKNLEISVRDWLDVGTKKLPPRNPTAWKRVKLGDKDLFNLSIGRRVLKKDIYQNRTGVPLFSANIRKPFGFVHNANAGNLQYGGCLWSIDSDFDCRGVAAGESYSITDHCGQVEILSDMIDPHYIARQIRQSGNDQGFNRDYRPSLGIMADLEVDLPIDNKDEFDILLMKEWTVFQEEIDKTIEDIEKTVL